MQKKRKIVITFIVISLCFLLAGCGNKAKLEDNHTILEFDDSKITADNLYEKLKEKYGISALIDLMDHQLLDEKYKTDDTEKEAIDNQIKQMKMQYSNNEEAFLSAIQQYLGVKDEEELRDMLSLEYKRNLAVEDYIKDHIEDDEINKYYDEEIIGDMKVRHILIKPDTNQDMSSEEIEEAENKAKSEAEELIKKLDDGANFEELAKEYSDDTGSASDGGLIDYFNKDSNMDESFLEASIALEKDSYTKEPVKSIYGYHIILKIDQKEKPDLKDVKDSILEDIMNEKLDSDSTLRYQSLIDFREEAGLSFYDDDLKREYDDLMNQMIESARNS